MAIAISGVRVVPGHDDISGGLFHGYFQLPQHEFLPAPSFAAATIRRAFRRSATPPIRLKVTGNPTEVASFTLHIPNTCSPIPKRSKPLNSVQ